MGCLQPTGSAGFQGTLLSDDSLRNPAYAHGGYQQPGIQQQCFKCKGNGWFHDSDMDHDKPSNEKCFFCDTCSGCKGKGYIMAPATVQTVTVTQQPVIMTQQHHVVAAPHHHHHHVIAAQPQAQITITQPPVHSVAGVQANMTAAQQPQQPQNVSVTLAASGGAQPQVQPQETSNVSVGFTASSSDQMGKMFNQMGGAMGGMWKGATAMMKTGIAANAQHQDANVSVSMNVSSSNDIPQVHLCGEFTAPYLFAHPQIVVIQHKLGKCLRVQPNNLGHLDPNGGTGAFAQWEAQPLHGVNEVKLKSRKSGKYLRIDHDGHIDVIGTGGIWTIFIVHSTGHGTIKLESKQRRGQFIAVQQDNVIRVGNGGPWCELNVYRNPSLAVPIVAIVPQVTTTVTEVASNEACPKCRGHGWVHESDMNHDKVEDEKCFFCEDCSGCGGKGHVAGTKQIISTSDAFGHSTVQTVSHVDICGVCHGHGWRHTSDMEHKGGDPEKRCFFCEDCDACDGTGR